MKKYIENDALYIGTCIWRLIKNQTRLINIL